MRSALRLLVATVGLVLVLAACTPREIALFNAVTEKHRSLVTDKQLRILRNCESGGRYDAIGGRGAFRGAYQFRRATWNWVAELHYPWLVGRDPARVEFWWQDAMARALYAEEGWSPWRPGCGDRLV